MVVPQTPGRTQDVLLLVYFIRAKGGRPIVIFSFSNMAQHYFPISDGGYPKYLRKQREKYSGSLKPTM